MAIGFDYLEYHVKKYSDDFYKHIYLKRCISSYATDFNFGTDDRPIGESKLDNNISRAKSKIFEYAMCNDFDYFMTFTLDKERYDRYDLGKFRKDFDLSIRHYRHNHSIDVQYVTIPETHKDGAWHMHGLLKGKLDDLFINTNGYLDWRTYAKKFGNISLSPIQFKYRCAKYMTKYISKTMSNTITELGAHLYYASKGLKTAEQIVNLDISTLEVNPAEMDFQNRYCMIKVKDNYDWVDQCESSDKIIVDWNLNEVEPEEQEEIKKLPPIFTSWDFEQLKMNMRRI